MTDVSNQIVRQLWNFQPIHGAEHGLVLRAERQTLDSLRHETELSLNRDGIIRLEDEHGEFVTLRSSNVYAFSVKDLPNENQDSER